MDCNPQCERIGAHENITTDEQWLSGSAALAPVSARYGGEEAAEGGRAGGEDHRHTHMHTLTHCPLPPPNTRRGDSQMANASVRQYRHQATRTATGSKQGAPSRLVLLRS